MISKDTTQQYDPDCFTCTHRVKRHPSKRENPTKPRTLRYVCLVEGKPIGEHGNRTQHTRFDESGKLHSKWVYDCPCRIFDKEKQKWVPCDWEPKEKQQREG